MLDHFNLFADEVFSEQAKNPGSDDFINTKMHFN